MGKTGRRSATISALLLVVAIVGLICWAADAQSVPGVSGKIIKVGAYVPETGPVPFYMRITYGATAYFKWINEKGGINGYTFDYVTRDDGYQAARTLAVSRQLAEQEHVFGLVAPIGTPNSVAAMPYLERSGLPVIGPVGAAPVFSRPPKKNVFTLLPLYDWEGAFAAEYAITKLGKQHVAVLYENDELGRPAFKGAEAVLRKAHLALATALPFDVTEVDFSSYAARLKAAGADTVLVWGSNKNFASVLRESDRIGFKPAWFAPFFVADPVTFKLGGDLVNGAYFASWLIPLGSNDPNLKEYKEALSKYYPKEELGIFSMNGWTHAAVFARAVELATANGGALTRERAMQALESIKDQKIGLAGGISFSATEHNGVSKVTVLQARNGQFEQVSPFLPLNRLDVE